MSIKLPPLIIDQSVGFIKCSVNVENRGSIRVTCDSFQVGEKPYEVDLQFKLNSEGKYVYHYGFAYVGPTRRVKEELGNLIIMLLTFALERYVKEYSSLISAEIEEYLHIKIEDLKKDIWALETKLERMNQG